MTLGRSDGMVWDVSRRQESERTQSVRLAPGCAAGRWILIRLAHKEHYDVGVAAATRPHYPTRSKLHLSIQTGSAEPHLDMRI